MRAPTYVLTHVDMFISIWHIYNKKYGGEL